MMKVPEQYRVKSGPLASTKEDGNNGYFAVPFKDKVLGVIASDGLFWDHVSVSLYDRTPTWDEMCFIKNLFFDKEDCVVQYHPPQKEYVNMHPHCLHLWRSQKEKMPIPPSILVGFK